MQSQSFLKLHISFKPNLFQYKIKYRTDGENKNTVEEI